MNATCAHYKQIAGGLDEVLEVYIGDVKSHLVKQVERILSIR
jgi:hypothetical protein